jgi:hypothetical protein
VESLLGKILENQLQDSARRKRALKARRRRERRRRNREATFNQQPKEFPTTLPYGPPFTTGIVDIPPAAVAGTQPPIEDWAPSEGVNQGDTEWMNWIETEISSDVKPERQQEVQVLAARPVQSRATPGAWMLPCSPHDPTGNGQRQAQKDDRDQNPGEEGEEHDPLLRRIQDTETHVG